MILNKETKDNFCKKLKKLGFYSDECKTICSKFEEKRIEDSISYLIWLRDNKTNREYEKAYFYYLLHNFDETKVYPAYSDYLELKKNVAKLPQRDTTKTIIGECKIGEDVEIKDDKPKNILEFIKHGTNKENRQ